MQPETQHASGPTLDRQRPGFTLIELLVVIAIITILASMLMPSLSKAKGKGHQIQCLNHERQLTLALKMYADDSDQEFPARRELQECWMETLRPYYINRKLLKCNRDSFLVQWSYVINGWNDHFEATLSPEEYAIYKAWRWPRGMKESAVPYPSETIAFGEKHSRSFHVHMDFYQGQVGNDVEEIAQKKHGDGANFAFVDGSVRLLRFGKSISPINLWAVTDKVRNTALPVQ
jgi:prepilin-type N-terminal cleavage/methylation domain-containing protein/prepilin-type processing-associated H-X9-DG protein